MKNKEKKILLINFLKEYKKIINEESNLCSKIFQVDFFDKYHNIINILLSGILSTSQIDWISWWMFETDFGNKKDFANSVIIDKRSFILETYEEFVDFLFIE